jgi:hypothetical protein
MGNGLVNRNANWCPTSFSLPGVGHVGHATVLSGLPRNPQWVTVYHARFVETSFMNSQFGLVERHPRLKMLESALIQIQARKSSEHDADST